MEIGKRMKVGPKGQVVIPKKIRNELSLREGSDVLITLRDGNIVVSIPKPITESYVEYYKTGYTKKINKKVDLKKIFESEYYERNLLH
jgi:AbrB family looped-hinge helix DNA binding protein